MWDIQFWFLYYIRLLTNIIETCRRGKSASRAVSRLQLKCIYICEEINRFGSKYDIMSLAPGIIGGVVLLSLWHGSWSARLWFCRMSREGTHFYCCFFILFSLLNTGLKKMPNLEQMFGQLNKTMGNSAINMLVYF